MPTRASCRRGCISHRLASAMLASVRCLVGKPSSVAAKVKVGIIQACCTATVASAGGSRAVDSGKGLAPQHSSSTAAASNSTTFFCLSHLIRLTLTALFSRGRDICLSASGLLLATCARGWQDCRGLWSRFAFVIYSALHLPSSCPVLLGQYPEHDMLERTQRLQEAMFISFLISEDCFR